MHVNPLLRSFHSSSPLFEENPSTETKATETPAGSEAKTDAPKTVEEQLADVKKQLEKSMKDVWNNLFRRWYIAQGPPGQEPATFGWDGKCAKYC